MTFFATTSKRAAVFAALFLLASVPSFAQSPLNISYTDFLNSLSQLSSTQATYNDTNTAGLQALVNQTGANQTWNFQSLPPFVLDTSSNNFNGTFIAYSQSLPEADSFPTATNVETSTTAGITSYYFYEINSSGFYALGASQDSMGLNPKIVQTVTPPEETYAFPLTYPMAPWSSTSVVTQEGLSGTEEVDGSVDGWGTYSLPGNNTPIQALRIKTKTIESSSNGSFVYADTSYSFRWISSPGYSATISANANQIATRASYATPGAQNIVLNNTPSSQYSIFVGSNPISSPTNVSFTLPSEAPVRISLMDALGKQSQVLLNGMAHAGVNMLPLDPATLMNGTYFLRIESAGNASTQKVIVNH
jgi:hypothetical protein